MGSSDSGALLRAGSKAVTSVPSDSRDRLLELTDRLASVHAAAAPEFLKSAPGVLERVTFAQMAECHRCHWKLRSERIPSGLGCSSRGRACG